MRVLQSFPEPRPTTNPYIVLLRRALDDLPDVELQTFSWKRALTGQYDVFHVHWPEVLLSGTSRPRTALRHVLFVALLVRLGTAATPIVHTQHNVRPQEDVSRTRRVLLALLQRRTAMVIRLNEETAPPAGKPFVTIRHGHYKDWFAAYPEPDPEPGRLAFVGLIRPYKNVEGLLKAFREASEQSPTARLVVAGKPATPELAAAIRAAAAGLDVVSLELEFLPDERLVQVVGRAELVVLPYREMHNSGAALMALSLGRPVLVPDNAVNADLAAEVGPDWVHRYSGELSADHLLEGLRAVRTIPPGATPDLSHRGWEGTATEHLAAYRQALSRRDRARVG
jgi:beta-1,4-mannosyltransferase